MGSENNMVAVPVTDADRALRDQIIDLDWPGNHAAYEAELDQLIARYRLAQPDAQQGASSPASGEGSGTGYTALAMDACGQREATPLAAATQPAVPQEGAVERAARAMCRADGLDPDEEIIGGQATGFENYGPLWQAEERSEGQLGITNYKRLARAALTGAGENGEQGA